MGLTVEFQLRSNENVCIDSKIDKITNINNKQLNNQETKNYDTTDDDDDDDITMTATTTTTTTTTMMAMTLIVMVAITQLLLLILILILILMNLFWPPFQR